MAHMISPKAIQLAIRQIDRWMFASKQDRNPGIALLHANYAVGDLDMLRQAASDIEINNTTGRNSLALFHKAIVLQDHAQERVRAICPKIFE